MTKEKIIKKVRKEIKPKLTKEDEVIVLMCNDSYDRGYADGYTTAKNKTKEKYEIGIFIVVLALLTALAIYKSL